MEKVDNQIRFISNPLVKLDAIQKAIESNCDIHFGIRAGQLSDDLIKAVVKDINIKYGTLSIQDISYAFDKFVTKKTDWRNITKAEILEPINKWWCQKETVRYEFNQFEREQREKENSLQSAEIFKNDSLSLYKECLSSGIWTGDLFQASSIAKDFISKHLNQDIKDQLWIQAKRDKKEAEAIADQMRKDGNLISLTPEMIGANEIRIYSNLMVAKAIELKIKI